MRFAHMKRILEIDRLRLRSLSGASDEVLLSGRALQKLTAPPLPRCKAKFCNTIPPYNRIVHLSLAGSCTAPIHAV